MKILNAGLVACFLGSAVIPTDVQSATGNYVGFDFSGCSKDHKKVMQKFVWNKDLGKPTVSRQSAAVRQSFSSTVKKYTASEIKSGAHRDRVLTAGKAHSSVSSNPPKILGAC